MGWDGMGAGGFRSRYRDVEVGRLAVKAGVQLYSTLFFMRFSGKEEAQGMYLQFTRCIRIARGDQEILSVIYKLELNLYIYYFMNSALQRVVTGG